MVVLILYENARMECQSHTEVQMSPIHSSMINDKSSWVINDKSYPSLPLSLYTVICQATYNLTAAIPSQSSDHNQWRRAGKTSPA